MITLLSISSLILLFSTNGWSINVTFHNANCDSVRVYFNNNGSETLYYTLASDESVVEATSFGENWVFKEYLAGAWTTTGTYAVVQNSHHTYHIITRDVIKVDNGLTCDVTMFYEELDGPNAGQVFNMGVLSSNSSMVIKPASDRARVYGELSGGGFTNELTTKYDGNNDNKGCYNLYLESGCDKLVEICHNGLDDDNDGLADCDDPDCGGTKVSPSASASICNGQAETVFALAVGGIGPFTFNWSHGLGSGEFKTVSPTSTTTYSVTVTNAGGCTDVGQTTITVLQSPTANAGADQNICRFTSTTLNASATGGVAPYNYSWSHAPGTGNGLSVTPLVSKDYIVTVTSDNGCIDTDTLKVTVQTCFENCSDGIDNDADGLIDCMDTDCGPRLDAGPNLNTCPGEPVSLKPYAYGGNGLLTYEWSNGITTVTQEVAPMVTTTYYVTVTAPSGCFAVDSVVVNAIPCGEDCTNGIDDDGDGLVDCDDPDCVLLATPDLMDDEYTTCPSMPLTERVTYNDNNLLNPVFSIVQHPSSGSVSIDGTGKFYFTPPGEECVTETFRYRVCNQASGCCAEATVTIHFNDGTAPILTNVPADITLSCDDIIPTPPNITAFDACPGIIVDFLETSNEYAVGACAAYEITRTWKATDLCGNSSTNSQVITIKDNVAPEIYQLYTLESGQRVIAGVSHKMTHEWKYIPFPISFGQTPMIFTTVVSNNDFSAVTVRQRNPYSQGFEMRLMEEEGADGEHLEESVAWIAIERGTNDGNLKLESFRWDNVDHNPVSLAFSPMFGGSPGVITSIQSTNEEEPAVMRLNGLTASSITAFVQEEKSRDAETNHSLEHIGYLAFKAGQPLTDKNQVQFGETGKMNLTNAWTTIELDRNYTNPVVVFGGISNNHPDGVNVRVRNLTSHSFEVRLQEWNYLDGLHPTETVSWIVMEGSVPGNTDYYCFGGGEPLRIGRNIFSVDNCDDQSTFTYNKSTQISSQGMITTREWTAVDDCGNTKRIVRTDTCGTAALEVKAVLAGASVNNGVSGLMRDDLRIDSLIPVEEPFSDLPGFPHVVDTTPNDDIDHDGPGADTIFNDLVLVCHESGTPNEVTLAIPSSAISLHQIAGDYMGACTNPALGIPAGVFTAKYLTVKDGDWNSPATWAGGNVPPAHELNNTTVAIRHIVTLPSETLKLTSNTTMWLFEGAQLTIAHGDLRVYNGDVYLYDSELHILDGELETEGYYAELQAFNSKIEISKDFDFEDGIFWVQSSCLEVGGNMIVSGRGRFHETTIVANGHFNKKGWGVISLTHTNIKVKLGNFINGWFSPLYTDSLIVWAPNGHMYNSGIWTGKVQQFCIGGNAAGFWGQLPVSEDCAGMADYFNTCQSLLPPTIIIIEEADTSYTEDEIALTGTLAPQLLKTPVEPKEAIVDWLLIEIRDIDTEKVLDYATAVVQRDGDIVSEDGDAIINFPNLPEGDYYVTLRHRNHLPLMTEIPLYLTIYEPPVVDYTDPALPIRGGETGGFIKNNERIMWGGDFNEDDKVIFQGPNNDVFFLFSQVLGDQENEEYLANFILREYDHHDFNLDGEVIFQGPNNDKASLLYHTIMMHTGNSTFLANFIVKGYLP